MRRLVEPIAFVALAIGVHLAFALQISDGNDAGGTGGTELVTINASAAAIETMVANWQRPPDVSARPDLPDQPETANAPPPVTTAPDLPVLRSAALTLPSANREDTRQPRIDLSTPPPDAAAPQARTQAPALPPMSPPTMPRPPEARPSAAPSPPQSPRAPQVQPTAPDDAPQVETTPPERPEPPKQEPAKKAKPADKAQQATAGSAAQRAAGSGGLTQAGASGTSSVSTLSKGQKTRLISVWGSKIRSRIERRKAYPRGNHGSGRVVVSVTVGRDGRLMGASIIRSSGIAALDKAAMQAISRAGRMPGAPKGLEKASYTFRLPMDFSKR